ncbi:MAG: hypothetical protein ACPIOQ_09250, partial [Promethearchaeia archaeon]
KSCMDYVHTVRNLLARHQRGTSCPEKRLLPDQAAEFLLAMDLTVLLQVRSRDSRAAPGRQQLAAFAWPRLLSRTGFFLFQVFILIHTMSCIQQPRSCAFAMPLGVMLRPCPRSSVLTCRANSLAPRCWKTLPCMCFTCQ